MADTHVEIDLPGGGGPLLDTRTEASNGNHRQVVVLGDPSTNAGVAPVDATNGLAVDVKQQVLPAGSVAGATATTKDYDTGGGTDTVLGVGILLPGAGGSVAGGTSTNPVRTDPTGTTTQPVSGTVAVSGTTTTQDTASKADDAAFTPAVDRVIPAGFIADETGTDAVDEGDVGAARIDVNRRQLIRLVGATDANRADVDASGHLQVDLAATSATVTVAGDVGTIDQFDLANSNPVTVAIVDGAGDQITSFGGGTQYTEDAAAAANPVGTSLNLIREDARAGGLTTTDGDNVAARGTNAGELYVKHVDSIPVTDNAGSLTIDNAALSVTGGGVEAAALRVTIANDSTGVLSVDDNGASLTVDGTVAVSSITTSVIPGTAATNLGKAEDAGHNTGDTGVMALAVRQSTATDLSAGATDGDYEPLQVSATGRLWVDPSGVTLTVASHAVTNAGTFVVQENGAALTALQLIDDTVQVLGTDTYTEATSKGITMGAVRRDADTTLVNTTNEFGPLQMDANGHLKVEIFDGGDSHTVDGTVTANLAAGTNNIGDVDVLSIIPGTGATNLGKAIDTATGATDTGVLALATRDDALTSLTPVDGDNVQLRTNARGATWIAIEDGAGGQVTTFGGGTQYTEADTDASITGTAMLWEDAADTLRAVSAAKPLPVEVIAGATSGTEYVDDTSTHATGTTSGFVFMAAATPTDGSVDANDIGAVAMSTDRRLHTVATQSGTWNVTNVSGTVSLPTGASTLAEQQTQTAHLATIAGDTTDIEAAVELIDDTVATLGTTTYTETTTKGLIIGAVRRDADTTLVDTTNEVSPLQVDANGRLKVEAFSGETLPVSGTVTANQGGSPWQVQSNSANIATQTTVAAIQTSVELIDDAVFVDDTATHSTGSTKVIGVGAAAAPTDTAVNANDIGMVGMTVNRQLYSSIEAIAGNTVLTGNGATGTGSIRVTLANDSTGTTVPGGNVAHDAGDSGSPIKIGAKAETSPKGITLVADGDRTDLYADADGMLMVKLNTANGDLISEAVSDTGGSSTAFSNFSAVASTRNYVTAISVFRTDTATTMAYVDFRDGTAGSVLYRMPLPPTGGSVIANSMPFFKTTANTALAYDVSSALTTVYISISGFQSKA